MAQLRAYLMVQLLVYKFCVSDDYMPPRILYPDTREYLYYPEGHELVLTCIAQGEPKITYKWIQNGTDIVQTGFIHFDSESGALSFSQFSWREQGSYRCMASNEFQDGTSGTIRLTSMSPIIDLWQISLEEFGSPQPINIQAVEYDYLQLPCGHTKTSIAKELTYAWFDTGTKYQLTLDDGRLFIDKDGNLHFAYVIREDGSRDGYVCSIFTLVAPGLRKLSRGSKIVLTVSSRAVTATKPTIKYRTAKVTARVSSTATLECLFSGYDASKANHPAQKWGTTAQVPYSPSSGKYNVSSNGRRLTIANVQEEDEKSYNCYGTNYAGTESASVELRVISEPIFIKRSPLVDKTLPGRDYQFPCETRSVKGGSPPRTPIWYINSRKLNALTVDKSKFEFSHNNQILTVKHSDEPPNFVCVQCDVYNDVDVTSASTCIAGVATPITILMRPPERQEITHGTVVNLSFNATAGPSTRLKYGWMFQNEANEVTDSRKPPPYVYFNPYTMTAFINTSSLTRDEYKTIAGQYSIIICSPYENATVKTVVVLLDVEDEDGVFAPSVYQLLLIAGIVVLSVVNVVLMYKFWKIIRRPTPPVKKVKKVDPVRRSKQSPRFAPQPIYIDEDDYETVLTEESLESSSVDVEVVKKR
ncbi:hypothetical protein BsWGS_14234 [Bradybaena similaris]